MKHYHSISHAWLIILFAMLGGQASAQDDTLTILMRQLEDIEVSAMRVQQTTLSTAIVKSDELNHDNTGQNLPYLLLKTPG